MCIDTIIKPAYKCEVENPSQQHHQIISKQVRYVIIMLCYIL